MPSLSHCRATSPASARPAAEGPPQPSQDPVSGRPSVFLFVILAAQLMVVLDTTIVNVALPHIQEGLLSGLSGGELSWVINGCLLSASRSAASCSSAPAPEISSAGAGPSWPGSPSSRPARSSRDRLSPAGCSSPARALQGVGAALAASVLAGAPHDHLLGRSPAGARHRPLHDGVGRRAGGAIGLVAGGALTQLVSWRWVMFVNVPIGIAVLLVGRIALQETPRRRRPLRYRRRPHVHVGHGGRGVRAR